MRIRLKAGLSSSVVLVVSVACSGSVDRQTGTIKDRDASSAEGGRSSGSGGDTANGAGGGDTDVGTGGSAQGGVSGAGGDKGSGGLFATGGTGGKGHQGTGGVGGDSATTGTLTQSCGVVGAYGCAGHAQKGQLICTGTWGANGNCAGSNNCDTTPGANAGSCQPIVTECLGKKPGDNFCQGNLRMACGPDLVTITMLENCYEPDGGVRAFCEEGVCKGP
jgi:hypothetical protein